MVNIAFHHAGNSIDLSNAVDLITKKFHADRPSGPVCRIDLQRISANTEFVTGKIQIVSFIANLRELAQNIIDGPLLSHTKGNDHAFIINRVAQAVKAADRGNHDHIPTLKQRRGGTMAQTVDLLIHRGIFLNIGISVGDIGFRLVVIIIGNKIFNRVIGEEFTELRAKLRCKGLVMSQHQCGAVGFGDDVRHGKGLATAGNT